MLGSFYMEKLGKDASVWGVEVKKKKILLAVLTFQFQASGTLDEILLPPYAPDLYVWYYRLS